MSVNVATMYGGGKRLGGASIQDDMTFYHAQDPSEHNDNTFSCYFDYIDHRNKKRVFNQIYFFMIKYNIFIDYVYLKDGRAKRHAMGYCRGIDYDTFKFAAKRPYKSKHKYRVFEGEFEMIHPTGCLKCLYAPTLKFSIKLDKYEDIDDIVINNDKNYNKLSNDEDNDNSNDNIKDNIDDVINNININTNDVTSDNINEYSYYYDYE